LALQVIRQTLPSQYTGLMRISHTPQYTTQLVL